MEFIQSCKMPIYLAYAMSAYSLASLLYILATRNIGTPLRDSYTAEQLEIKKDSAYKRARIFYMSLAISILILFLIKPFNKCF